jgi:hypothetical protein
MSGARVERLHGTSGTLILKQTPRATEPDVYRSIAPILRDHGINLPECFGIWDDKRHWLLLEDVPAPLPRERWIADPGQLELLARLHALPVGLLAPLRERYRPAWDDALTEAALALLPDVDPDLLRTTQADSQPLFIESAVISGDPNPQNWGVRDDGALVLFDWERLTLGDPAIDLAITVPGLPDIAPYQHVAARYVEITRSDDDVTTLVQRMRLAKLWTVIELLAGVTRGNVDRNGTIDWLIAEPNRWLELADPCP